MLKLAFVTGLSNKKLAQKLAPLQAMPEVEAIDVYRRLPFSGLKINWMRMPHIFSESKVLGDLYRFAALLINGNRYNVIIGCNQEYHGLYAAIAGFIYNKKVVQLVINDMKWINKMFMAGWVLKQAAALGFRGGKSIKSFQQRYGNKQICFVPHNVWEPKNGSNSKNNSKKKSIDLLYVGYLAHYKNIPDWLKTAAKVKARLGQINAVMVGEFPDKKLQSLIKKLELEDDIKFPGPVYGDDLVAYYKQSELLLMTSFYEGIPMVALEAMLYGVAVIVTDVGDTGDLIDNTKNGYLFNVGDIDKATELICMLLRDNKQYLKVSKNANVSAQRFLEKCTLEAVTNEWRTVFEKMDLPK